MDYDKRRAFAMYVAPAVTGLLVWLVLLRKGAPLPWIVKRPLFAGIALALIFGPVLIGNYFAGRKGKPPLS